MQFRDFPMIFCRKSMDYGPDFVQNHDFNRDFHKNLIFFENFLRNCPKFVYLWKISILSMDMFLVLLNFFWSNSEIVFQILVTPCQGMLIFCAKLRKFTKNQHIWVHLSKEWPEFEKKSQNLTKKILGASETYSCSRC